MSLYKILNGKIFFLLQVNRHVLYSYQACPAESNQARVINMLDLRKTKEIKLVDEGASGLFCIVPVSTDGNHPGYLMRADTQAQAQEWVHGLNRVREQEISKTPLETDRPVTQTANSCCSCCFPKRQRRGPAEREPLVK
uniref:PH domain-containing protein n=1 Tax=Aureoumbra lagunensis TaxID=44058 RepID=A0A7S3K4R5_9STRA